MGLSAPTGLNISPGLSVGDGLSTGDGLSSVEDGILQEGSSIYFIMLEDGTSFLLQE